MDFTLNTLFPEVLSTTQDIELYSACNYKWFLRRCAKFTKYAYNNDLEAGSEFAKACEITRNAYYKQGLPELDAIELGKKNILESFGATYAEATYQDDLKTPEKLVEVFDKMFTENLMSESTITPFEMADGNLSVEQDFSVELPFIHPETGKPIILKCLLDMLGTKQNTVYVVDEKTCKSVLSDAIKQADLLRTQNQFVQYVTVGNMNKDKFGGLSITHVCINRCKIKKNYAKNESVVEAYEFVVDVWFQKTWWNNLLYLVQDMLKKYKYFKEAKESPAMGSAYEVIFPRAYGQACTAFFSPCPFTYHCTSGNAQDLEEQGFKQVVQDSRTKYQPVALHKYKEQLFNPTE